MQKMCTSAEELSTSPYSGRNCTLWDLITKKIVNCYAWSNRIDYYYKNSMNVFRLFFLRCKDLYIYNFSVVTKLKGVGKKKFKILSSILTINIKMKTRPDNNVKMILTKSKQFQHTSGAINEIKICLSHKSRR